VIPVWGTVIWVVAEAVLPELEALASIVYTWFGTASGEKIVV
jgi:hypothetical protein